MRGERKVKPRIQVLSLGGTISAIGSPGKGVAPSMSASELVASIPALAGLAEISTTSLRTVGSPNLTMTDIADIADEVSGQGFDGIVITQGTDTLEETSFALDLLLEPSVPIVMTGAMRNPTLPGADGPANLLAAVAVAGTPAARGQGVLVVLNDEIHAAAHVQKTHSQQLSAFAAEGGPLGWVEEGSVRFQAQPMRRPRFPSAGPFPPVAQIKLAFGDDGRLLAALPQIGYAGAVIEGMGGGHVPGRMVSALEELMEAMPVVLASRTRRGDILRRTYDFAGSEMDLYRRGLISAGWLDPLKANVLLTILLGSSLNRTDIAAAFDNYLYPDRDRK